MVVIVVMVVAVVVFMVFLRLILIDGGHNCGGLFDSGCDGCHSEHGGLGSGYSGEGPFCGHF